MHEVTATSSHPTILIVYRGEDEEQCPVREPGTVLLGRTEYNIMMYDTRTKGRKWNITYYDYSSNLGTMDTVKDYDLAHFTDSSTGTLISLDKNSGIRSFFSRQQILNRQ